MNQYRISIGIEVYTTDNNFENIIYHKEIADISDILEVFTRNEEDIKEFIYKLI